MSHLKDEVYLKRRVLNLQWAGLELWQAWLRVQHRSWVSFQLPLRPATLKTVDDRGSWVLGIRANTEVRIYEHHTHMFKKPKAVKLCAKQGFDTWPFPAKRAVDIGAITIGWLGFMTISSLIICRIWLTQSGSFSRPEDVAILSSYFCSTNRPLLYVLRCREYREAKSMKSWNAYALK